MNAQDTTSRTCVGGAQGRACPPAGEAWPPEMSGARTLGVERRSCSLAMRPWGHEASNEEGS